MSLTSALVACIGIIFPRSVIMIVFFFLFKKKVMIYQFKKTGRIVDFVDMVTEISVYGYRK